jgi:hypothetical protein
MATGKKGRKKNKLERRHLNIKVSSSSSGFFYIYFFVNYEVIE